MTCSANAARREGQVISKAIEAINGIKRRGFGSMDPARQLAIARKGGAAVPPEKRSFPPNAELAREAGRKGGARSSERRIVQ